MIRQIQTALGWSLITSLLTVFSNYFDRYILDCFAVSAFINVLIVLIHGSWLIQLGCFFIIGVLLWQIAKLIEKKPLFHIENLIGQTGIVIDHKENTLIVKIGKRHFKAQSVRNLKINDSIKVLKVTRTKLFVRKIRKKEKDGFR